MTWRLGLITVLLLALAAALVWRFGPRESSEATIRFDPAVIGRDPERYLAESEAAVPNLRDDARKEIVWAYPASRARTPLAIVYIHGFSGTKAELRPVPDEVARRLGANLFFARLSGHGRDGAAMAEPTVDDWLNDLAEAVAIGRRIGERVVVIGTSTGATLATYGTQFPGLLEGVAGLVLVSPNYRLADWRSFALTLPFSRTIVSLFYGEHGFAPLNAEHGAHWTTRYPGTALLPMAALVDATRAIEFAAIQLPALFVYSPRDQIVDPQTTLVAAEAWGGPSKVLAVTDTQDPTGHILAGDILSPITNEALASAIVEWVERGLEAADR